MKNEPTTHPMDAQAAPSTPLAEETRAMPKGYDSPMNLPEAKVNPRRVSFAHRSSAAADRVYVFVPVLVFIFFCFPFPDVTLTLYQRGGGGKGRNGAVKRRFFYEMVS